MKSTQIGRHRTRECFKLVKVNDFLKSKSDFETILLSQSKRQASTALSRLGDFDSAV